MDLKQCSKAFGLVKSTADPLESNIRRLVLTAAHCVPTQLSDAHQSDYAKAGVNLTSFQNTYKSGPGRGLHLNEAEFDNRET